MKKRNMKMDKIIYGILAIPFFILSLVVLVIITPFDYFKYRRTRYYKDTHEKYSWFCASSYNLMFYDLIKKENLPIDFYRFDDDSSTGDGYFIYKDILILNDCDVYYDTNKNIWAVEYDDDFIELQKDVSDSIAECNKFLKKDVCKKAIVLIDSKLYNEHPGIEYELFDFVTVSNNNIGEALNKIILNYKE